MGNLGFIFGVESNKDAGTWVPPHHAWGNLLGVGGEGIVSNRIAQLGCGCRHWKSIGFYRVAGEGTLEIFPEKA